MLKHFGFTKPSSGVYDGEKCCYNSNGCFNRIRGEKRKYIYIYKERSHNAIQLAFLFWKPIMWLVQVMMFRYVELLGDTADWKMIKAKVTKTLLFLLFFSFFFFFSFFLFFLFFSSFLRSVLVIVVLAAFFTIL